MYQLAISELSRLYASIVMDTFEDSFSAKSVEETLFVIIKRKPDEDRFSYNMILRYKSPVSGISGVVSVVSHHPIRGLSLEIAETFPIYFYVVA